MEGKLERILGKIREYGGQMAVSQLKKDLGKEYHKSISYYKGGTWTYFVFNKDMVTLTIYGLQRFYILAGK